MTADTRSTIRAVALELFSDQGYRQTSLREIAERVGMTKASLYYHYPSKQALLRAIIDPLVADWRSMVDSAEAMRHSPENLRLVLRLCLDMLLRHRPIVGIFRRDAAGVVVDAGTIWEEALQLGSRLHVWLAGPEPTMDRRIRAIAATEVLGAALGSTAFVPAATDDELRTTLLDAASAVLQLTPPVPA